MTGCKAIMAALLLTAAFPTTSAHAESAIMASIGAQAAALAPLTGAQAARYQGILTALDGQNWTQAQSQITALSADDSMRPYLRASLYLAKGSPRVSLFDLLDLLHKAPYLPQAAQLGRLATVRGAETLPDRPEIRKLMWTGGAPQRRTLKAVADDPVADKLRTDLRAHIVADDPAGGEQLLLQTQSQLTPDGLTEMRQRLAWSYYLCGDLDNARRLAADAVRNGSGSFVAAAYWTMGLTDWRKRDWNPAARAFYQAARNANDADMRSGGYFWAARATMADRHPEQVDKLLQAAAHDGETFYGLLARETLGLNPSVILHRTQVSAQSWDALKSRPNARNAVILAALGDSTDADDVLRHEAQLNGDTDYPALVHLASQLSLPTTQLWLAQHSPDGDKLPVYARYPDPNWTPTNGWQVDKALVYAHALQESRFQTQAVSAAGARGVMQILPGTANDLAQANGLSGAAQHLSDPQVNLALGQLYLEKLSKMPATGGLLPKVVAAYNAGPTPVDRWNTQVRDDGDPLLFIESVPYYETRAYLNAVLRNYWIYQLEDQGTSPALVAMAQGLWTRFPDGKKTVAVRMTPSGHSYGVD